MSEIAKRQKTEAFVLGNILLEQDDLVIEIFGFVDFPTLVRIQRVCKYWKTVIPRLIPGRLGNKPFFTGEELCGRIREYIHDKVKYADELAGTYGWPIGKWNVSRVTNFSGAFPYENNFNEDIGDWDMSNAINLNCMFGKAKKFNQDLSRWKTSKVKCMYQMFFNATSFNGNISSWDTSNVIDMELMFKGATSFNQNISTWDVSSVEDHKDMFGDAESFNPTFSPRFQYEWYS